MDRDLAEKLLIGLAGLHPEGEERIAARRAVRLAAAFHAECSDPAPSPSLADGEWRDAPKPAAPSPAASPAPSAAAGLPVDESATKPVDREGLAKAIYEAVRAGNMLMGAKPWESAGHLAKNDSINAAIAALAFMAKGGAK